MTALAQGSAGLALVMSFGLLGTRQIGAATILLAIQSAATAVSAMSQHQPVIAAATLAMNLAGATWLLRDQSPDFEAITAPIGGAKLGIVAGGAFAVLSQSAGPLAGPVAVVLLSVLMAATRRHPLMHVLSLFALQNGIAAAACLVVRDPMLALTGFFPVVPLAAYLATDRTRLHDLRPPRWLRGRLGWLQVAAATALLGGTLVAGLDPLATLFAPLIALWGVAEAWASRNRQCKLIHHGCALIQLVFMVLAVTARQPVLAVLAAAIAGAAALFPTLRRGWDTLLLASSGTGLAVFGLLMVPAGQPVVSFAALILGLAAIIVSAPSIGMIAPILVLRLATTTSLPLVSGTILISVGVAGMLCCAGALAIRLRPSPAPLLRLAQLGIIAITLGLDRPQARFACCVMLVLLILSDAAERLARGDGVRDPAHEVAVAGLAGIPPFGLFPGLILSLLAIASQTPALLLPVGLGVTVMLVAAVPRSRPHWTWSTSKSAGWLPLGMAMLFGFCAPDDLVAWLRAITAGTP